MRADGCVAINGHRFWSGGFAGNAVYAAGSVAKQGASTKPSSRLGGVAIFVITSVSMSGSSY